MDEITKDAITKHQVAAGRIGGLSRSEAKREAVRANLLKARAKRWAAKGAGPQSNVLGGVPNEQGEPNSQPPTLPEGS
jgi:hypothetical protein